MLYDPRVQVADLLLELLRRQIERSHHHPPGPRYVSVHARNGQTTFLVRDLLDAVPVVSPSGLYVLEAECFRYGGDCRIARVTATCARRRGERGSLYGAFGVDVACACIFDYDAIEGYADSDEDDFVQWVDHFIIGMTGAVCGSIACPPARTTVEYFASGFGDGTYAVYELRDDYEVVGVEVVFLEDDASYPFGE